ncbi:hypothetical protein L1887_41935 [Cichorium endivia]|nr:hypothetical protein L1887_41935 [Cichorium endivia]
MEPQPSSNSIEDEIPMSLIRRPKKAKLAAGEEEPSDKPPTYCKKKIFKFQRDVRQERKSPSDANRRQQELEKNIKEEKVAAAAEEERKRLIDVASAE